MMTTKWHGPRRHLHLHSEISCGVSGGVAEDLLHLLHIPETPATSGYLLPVQTSTAPPGSQQTSTAPPGSQQTSTAHPGSQQTSTAHPGSSKHPDYIFIIFSNPCFIMQYHYHHPIQMDVGNQENNFHQKVYEAAAAMATDAHWKSETAKDLCDSSCCSCCHTGSLKWQRTCVTEVYAAAVARATNHPAGQEWWRTYKTSIHVATVAKVTDLSRKSGMVRGTCILESHSNCCHGHWPCLKGWSEPASWSSCSKCCHGYRPVMEGWSEPASWISCSNCCHGYWPRLEGWSEPAFWISCSNCCHGYWPVLEGWSKLPSWSSCSNCCHGHWPCLEACNGEEGQHHKVSMATVARTTDLCWKSGMVKRTCMTEFM